MLRYLIVLSVSICALGASIGDDDPMPQLDGRIVGGAVARIDSYPWQVSIQRSGYHFCGGSIYSNNIIITAAHCLQKVSVDVLKVRAGSSIWKSGGVLIPVASFKNHEDYNDRNMINDIAVIRLASPLTYSATIRSIPLATKTPDNGAVAAASGWGTTSYGSTKTPSRLQSVKVNIVSQNQCASNSYGYGSEVKSSMICASTFGGDACQGDSGGPLVSGGVLAGVVSWGYGCAYPNYPGVYSDVADLRSWVINSAAKI